jgi:hypothetical protein
MGNLQCSLNLIAIGIGAWHILLLAPSGTPSGKPLLGKPKCTWGHCASRVDVGVGIIGKVNMHNKNHGTKANGNKDYWSERYRACYRRRGQSRNLGRNNTFDNKRATGIYKKWRTISSIAIEICAGEEIPLQPHAQ